MVGVFPDSKSVFVLMPTIRLPVIFVRQKSNHKREHLSFSLAIAKNLNIKNMNTSFQPNSTRVFELDLDLYTDGDPELKRELIVMMIDNIRELQQSIKVDIESFKKTSHKIKPTISMVNDKELSDAIEDMKLMQQHDNKTEKISSFQRLCNEIVKLLERESA
jgi:hypothetical protein